MTAEQKDAFRNFILNEHELHGNHDFDEEFRHLSVELNMAGIDTDNSRILER